MKQVLIYNDDGSSLDILAKAKGAVVIASGVFVQTIPAIKKKVVTLGKEVFVDGVSHADWTKISALDKLYGPEYTAYLGLSDDVSA